jgi:hypothetical protein
MTYLQLADRTALDAALAAWADQLGWDDPAGLDLCGLGLPLEQLDPAAAHRARGEPVAALALRYWHGDAAQARPAGLWRGREGGWVLAWDGRPRRALSRLLGGQGAQAYACYLRARLARAGVPTVLTVAGTHRGGRGDEAPEEPGFVIAAGAPPAAVIDLTGPRGDDRPAWPVRYRNAAGAAERHARDALRELLAPEALLWEVPGEGDDDTELEPAGEPAGEPD